MLIGSLTCHSTFSPVLPGWWRLGQIAGEFSEQADGNVSPVSRGAAEQQQNRRIHSRTSAANAPRLHSTRTGSDEVQTDGNEEEAEGVSGGDVTDQEDEDGRHGRVSWRTNPASSSHVFKHQNGLTSDLPITSNKSFLWGNAHKWHHDPGIVGAEVPFGVNCSPTRWLPLNRSAFSLICLVWNL